MRKIANMIWIWIGVGLLSACGSDQPVAPDTSAQQTQTFKVIVETMGEQFSRTSPIAASRRQPITGASSRQRFDKLELLILENKVPAKVVYKTSFDGWSNTDNKVSVPWVSDSGVGREATVTLTGAECLPDADYMVYAVGYESGSFGGYQPFKDVKIGDDFRTTEVVTLPEGEGLTEIFAGGEIFHVQGGKIYSTPSDQAELEDGNIHLRRQVAGTFGYFTGIPAAVDGKTVAALRLVRTRKNQSIILGGFRGVDDSENFRKENVINGTNPSTAFDAKLAGSVENNAFIVYEINLANWFPGNTGNAALPLDENRDGILNALDTNWQIDTTIFPEGSISLPAGTVFGDSYLISVAMTEEDIAAGLPTFEFQVLDESGNILKSWPVYLRDLGGEELNQRTIVSLPEGGEGRTEITLEDNPETEYCYSIVRNRLYSMGEKAHGQSYGEDTPIDLHLASNLVLDSQHEWNTTSVIPF